MTARWTAKFTDVAATRQRVSSSTGHRALAVVAAGAGVAMLAATGLPVWPTVHHGHGVLDAVLVGAGMALAMMAPLAIPMCGTVARASLWWRRRPNVVVALAAFLGVWIVTAVGLHVLVAWLALPPLLAVAVASIAAVLCAARQFDRRHDRRIARCHRTRPLRPRRAQRDAARWGLDASAQCLRVCALPMLVTALVAGWAVVVAVTAVLCFERHYYPRPRQAIARAYVTVAVAAAALVALTSAMDGVSHDHTHVHHASAVTDIA